MGEVTGNRLVRRISTNGILHNSGAPGETQRAMATTDHVRMIHIVSPIDHDDSPMLWVHTAYLGFTMIHLSLSLSLWGMDYHLFFMITDVYILDSPINHGHLPLVYLAGRCSRLIAGPALLGLAPPGSDAAVADD